ncbi:hypothetical protein L1987_31981 [Smallanthus sonchifolius]|uniref:Uncharacterized protein n=1 Tax=Smallanthus sonchifolius TaxID=185202 RepID=A0ACB9I743_9ASTR|nr:hypothetical protein L1987_31981 [Smallanthus sonchifolius]
MSIRIRCELEDPKFKGLRLEIKVQSLEFKAQSAEFGVQGLEFGVRSSKIRSSEVEGWRSKFRGQSSVVEAISETKFKIPIWL